jgi:hypothetical protein
MIGWWWELAHTIVEVKKTQDPPSARQRTKKTGQFCLSPKAWESGGRGWWHGVCARWSLKVRKPRALMSKGKEGDAPAPGEERIHLSSRLFFLLGPRWMGCTLLVRGLLTPVLISSENTLTDTLRNAVLLAMWVSSSLGRLTCEINHYISLISINSLTVQ